MFDPQRLLGELLGGAMSGSLGGKKGKKRKGSSMLGGMSTGTKAQLGIGLLGVAIAAYDHYKNQPRPGAPQQAGGFPPGPGASIPQPPQQVPPPPPGGPPLAPPAAPRAAVPADPRARDMALLVQAMVAAAAADGHIDDLERAQILQRAGDAGLDPDTQAFLRAELDAPKSLAAIVGAARPEIAADLYAASCAAISLDSEAERVYLDTLATRLNVAPDVRAAIHQQLGMS
ncbi:MAG: tellurite resistance TerB family protein [Pseudomonadota bacterium]